MSRIFNIEAYFERKIFNFEVNTIYRLPETLDFTAFSLSPCKNFRTKSGNKPHSYAVLFYIYRFTNF